jgi:acyl-CoA synthetase (AMP-forming)/AMP-acid ligase II
VFGVEVQIVDADNHPVAAGIVGQIRYRGPTVASGFFNDPDNSKSAFVDGWFYPGDLGELNSEGYLFLRGRVKDMIIRGGVNIYPQEIETTLMNHPLVAEAAVIGVPSKEFDEEVCAFVRLSGNTDVGELETYCQGQLASYKIPRYVIFVNEFKLNSAGKILKSELIQHFFATSGHTGPNEH